MTKEKLIRQKSLLLYGILLIVLLCCHFRIDLSYGDDGFFAHVLDDKTWVQFLTDRYYWASSRILIEAIYIPITQYAPWLWRIMNSVFLVMILWQVNEFFGTEEKTKGILTGIILAAFVPLTAIMGAGWIATTANYVWTVAAGMTAMMPVRKWIQGRELRWWEYLIYIAALLYASNQEQMGALMLGFYTVFGLYLLIRRVRRGKEAPGLGKIHWQYVIFLLIAFGAVRFMANSPGNYWRTQHDIEAYFPDFAELSPGRKVFLGLLTTGHYYMSGGEGNWIVPLFTAATLAVLVRKGRKGNSRAAFFIKLAVTAVPFLFSVAVGHICDFLFHQGILHRGLYWLGLFWNDQLPEYVEYTETDVIIEVLGFGILFFCLFLGIWWAMDTLEEKLLFLLLPAAGLMSRVILGFSPSVYASGNRTTFFATFLFLCTAFYMLMHKVKIPFTAPKIPVVFLLLGIFTLAGCGKTDVSLMGNKEMENTDQFLHHEIDGNNGESANTIEEAGDDAALADLPQVSEIPVNTEAEDIHYQTTDDIDLLRAIHRCKADGENVYLAYSEPDLYIMPIGAGAHRQADIDNPEGMDVCSIAIDACGRIHLLVMDFESGEWFIWRLDEDGQVDKVIDVSAHFETKQIPHWFLIDKYGTYYFQWLMTREGIILDSEGVFKHRFTLESLETRWTYEAAVGKDGLIYLVYGEWDEKLKIGEFDTENGAIKKEDSSLWFSGEETFSEMSGGTDTNLLLFSPYSGVWAYDQDKGILENRVPLSDIPSNTDFYPLTFLPEGRLLLVGTEGNDICLKYIPAGK